jgi:hypothetical protein
MIMHRINVVAFCALALWTTTSRACINEYGTTIQGTAVIRTHPDVPNPRVIDRSHYEKIVETFTPRLDSSLSYKELSNLAVAHIYLGDTEKAISILEKAEQLNPNEYAIASNLGTAYELAGRNEEALKWIQEGIRRNPESHQGSEWIHARVLEAKIAVATDPNWLSAHSVTGLDFGDGDLPAYDQSQKESTDFKTLSDIHNHLTIQLQERRGFIPNADPYVACLMFDLADATAVLYTLEDAREMYELARELGFPRTDLLNRRLAAIERTARQNLISGWSLTSLVVAAITTLTGLLLFGLCVYVFIRRNSFLHQSAQLENRIRPRSSSH